MAMSHRGLVKLSEEAAEVIQVAQKLIAYPTLQSVVARDCGWTHPDGSNLTLRLQDELGDLIAAARFVVERLQLDRQAIDQRIAKKLALFQEWENEP